MKKLKFSFWVALACTVALIGFLSTAFHQNSTYKFNIDSNPVEKIQLFHSGDAVLVTDDTYITRILDHFNALTLEPESWHTLGFVYRISFLDKQDQVIYETDILSEQHLSGRKIVDGAIDLALLEAAYKIGTPIA